MAVRLIEVSHENEWQHKRQLEETLSLLGFEPKPSEDQARWRSDLHRALQAKGLDAVDLVNDFRAASTATDSKA